MFDGFKGVLLYLLELISLKYSRCNELYFYSISVIFFLVPCYKKYLYLCF